MLGEAGHGDALATGKGETGYGDGLTARESVEVTSPCDGSGREGRAWEPGIGMPGIRMPGIRMPGLQSVWHEVVVMERIARLLSAGLCMSAGQSSSGQIRTLRGLH